MLMTDALIGRSEFVGIDGVVHLCTGGESPFLKSHLDVLSTFAVDKSGGMAGRDRMFAHYAHAKQQIGTMVGCDPSEVAFLAHATEGVTVLTNTLDWKDGDNVVVANVEFPSDIFPYVRLKERGVEVRVVKARGWKVELDDLRAAMDRRTRVLSASQVSYVTGQRFDLAKLADLAEEFGAHLVVDATHALGVVPVDASLCSAVVSSCYKWLLATHGVGIFVGRRDKLGDLHPANVGWHSVEHRSGPGDPTRVDLRADAARLEGGNPSLIGVYVLENALEQLARLDPRRVESHALDLGDQIVEQIQRRRLPLMTPEERAERAGNTCFEFAAAEELTKKLAERNVLVWGSEGRIRVSGHVHNESADVEALFSAVDDVLR